MTSEHVARRRAHVQGDARGGIDGSRRRAYATTMRLKKPLAKLVGLERVCRIATSGRDGVTHVVPVCHVLENGKLYFASEKGARKVKNLRANPHAAVTVDLYGEDWSSLKGVMIQGSTAVIEAGPRFRKLRDLLYRKYPQYPDESAIGERDSVIVELTPEHVFSWGVE
jgi:nitroimidazol reductase NimA-like FMN-containing flavoprotein (pyridoxamine 5'-phosphate oxidase superfamily)